MKNKGIIAYGTSDDRLRLEAVATIDGKTNSSWIIMAIRKRFEELFGDLDPILTSTESSD